MKVILSLNNCGGGQWEAQMCHIPRVGEEIYLLGFLNGKKEKECKAICDKLRDEKGRKGKCYFMKINRIIHFRHKEEGDYIHVLGMLVL